VTWHSESEAHFGRRMIFKKNGNECASGLMLPDQFERKLNLAGCGLGGGEKSRALNTLSALIEDLKVVGWRGKIRAV